MTKLLLNHANVIEPYAFKIVIEPYALKLSIAQRSVGPILSDQTSCCAVVWMNLSSIWMNLILILHLQGEHWQARRFETLDSSLVC